MTKPVKEAQWVSNFSSYTTQRVTKTILTLCKILNPHEVFDVTPALSLGEGSTTDLIETWRNPGAPISDMSVKSLISQQDRAKHIIYQTLQSFRQEKSASKKS